MDFKLNQSDEICQLCQTVISEVDIELYTAAMCSGDTLIPKTCSYCCTVGSDALKKAKITPLQPLYSSNTHEFNFEFVVQPQILAAHGIWDPVMKNSPEWPTVWEKVAYAEHAYGLDTTKFEPYFSGNAWLIKISYSIKALDSMTALNKVGNLHDNVVSILSNQLANIKFVKVKGKATVIEEKKPEDFFSFVTDQKNYLDSSKVYYAAKLQHSNYKDGWELKEQKGSDTAMAVQYGQNYTGKVEKI